MPPKGPRKLRLLAARVHLANNRLEAKVAELERLIEQQKKRNARTNE